MAVASDALSVFFSDLDTISRLGPDLDAARNDVLRGFEHGLDRIEIAGTAFADLSIAQRSGHTFIDYGRASDLIKIADFTGVLTADDFL
ncbi:hypothetical protein [Antarcticimicrobium luteum]|uniref:Uncharacterized protein n=1 Tax=Antarcticimicrobium luteum TaxID=2547397 RepID=A0A4R5UQX0_9RHOB|nr:hypothetical protein [Antarcticimicrobium luteum]TDK41306.1 hypothetical protein E1832_21720 [Antarcticimicrobium luteum]